MSETQKFESWAVVELFGHQRIAGLVTEATIGGCAFLRVDVPEQPATQQSNWHRAQPAIPAYTRYFGQGAIYAMNPCSELIARRTAEQIRVTPPIAFEVPDLVQAPQLQFSGGDDLDDPDDPPLDQGETCVHGRAYCSECHA